MLMLSAHVLLRPADQVVPVATPVDDQYNLECYSMVNLLEGLSDGMSPYIQLIINDEIAVIWI